MREGEIIAFRATGEVRKRLKGDFFLCEEGSVERWPSFHPSSGESPILTPIPSTEIAQAERTLAAVEKWRHLLTAIATGNPVNDVYLAQMAKEVVGS